MPTKDRITPTANPNADKINTTKQTRAATDMGGGVYQDEEMSEGDMDEDEDEVEVDVEGSNISGFTT